MVLEGCLNELNVCTVLTCFLRSMIKNTLSRARYFSVANRANFADSQLTTENYLL